MTKANITARFPEGEPVDVPTYLKDHGNPEAAERWTEMHDTHGDKFKSQPDAADGAEKEANTMSTMDELKKLATWETGHIDEDAELPEGEGSLIPGLEDRRGSTIFAFVEACGDMEEDELVVIPGDDIMGRFEEGVSADPCENMSDAECDEWDANTEKYKDKFSALGELERMAGTYEEYRDKKKDGPPMSRDEWEQWNEQDKRNKEKDWKKGAMGELEHLAGVVPGVPDGTGPRGKSDKCPKRDKKDTSDKSAMSDLERMAGVDKEAISQETADFVGWAINQAPMTKNETIRMLKVAGLKDILPPRQKRQGPRFQQKDDVLIKAGKHKDKATAAPYSENDGKVGTVVGVEGMGVYVQFKTGQPVFFEDAQKTRGVGIYKYTPAFVMQGSKKLEMIYESGGKRVNPDRVIVVEQYMGRGKTVKRKAPYFTGHAFNARYNKAGGVYFTLFPQQRIAVNPQGGTTEAGFEATSINPDVGRLYYMGLMGKRPSGWKGELADLQAGSMMMAASAQLDRMANSVIPGDEMMSRFEEGKPADPCENMSDAECEKWKANTDKYKDKFDKEGKDGDELLGRFEEGVPADPCEHLTEDKCDEFKANTEKYKDQFDKQAAMGKTAGYTNYWTIKEPFTPDEWNVIMLAALRGITNGKRMKKIPAKSPVWADAFADYMAKNGIVVKGPNGSGSPIVNEKEIAINGDASARISKEMTTHSGTTWDYSTDLAHESFNFENKKSRDFCKTERKPYDMVVASILWWAKKTAPKKIDIGSDDGKPKKIFATEADKEAAVADVSERAFTWFSEVGQKFEKLPWAKAIDGLGRAISNKGRAEDVLDDLTDLDKAKMKAMLSKGGEKKLKDWLQGAFKKHGSDEAPARERLTQRDAAGNWIPDDLEKGRCTPAPNPDCPVGSPQYNLAQTFKDHPEWGEKGGKKARERMTQRTAAREPGGMYGFTKKVQADCETASRRLAKAAIATAKRAYTKDPRVAKFMATHAERSSSLSAKILVAAMKEMGPKFAADIKKQARLEELREARRGGWKLLQRHKKVLDKYLESNMAKVQSGRLEVLWDFLPTSVQNDLIRVKDGELLPNAAQRYLEDRVMDIRRGRVASDKTAGKAKMSAGSGSANAKYLDSRPPQMKAKILKIVAKHYGVSVSEIEGELKDRDAEDLYEYLAFDRSMAMQVYRDFKQMRLTSADKQAGKASYGLYGFKAKTASLGLASCNAIREEAGRIASDLHGRRAAKHARITEFLKHRSKRGRCLYSRMLARSYPDADMKIASVKPSSVSGWLAWED